MEEIFNIIGNSKAIKILSEAFQASIFLQTLNHVTIFNLKKKVKQQQHKKKY